MRRSEWAKPTSADEAYRRASGRRRYNLQRSEAVYKRAQLLKTMLRGKMPRRGEMERYARALGVSKATVSRDVARLVRLGSLQPADPTFAQLMRQLRLEVLRQAPELLSR